MPAYECRFLDENGHPLRTEVFRATDNRDAHREAMTRFTRIGRFSGYELWAEGRKVEEYRPINKRGTQMIYDVTVQAPAISEVITTEADSEEQAKERAVYSALQRQISNATVTVVEQSGR